MKLAANKSTLFFALLTHKEVRCLYGNMQSTYFFFASRWWGEKLTRKRVVKKSQFLLFRGI